MPDNYLPSVCLASPLHDPNARLSEMIRLHGKKLKDLYKNLICISVTHTTSPDIIHQLEKLEIKHEIIPKTKGIDVGLNMKNAISLGLQLQTSHIHLVDFDRALHWTETYPRELKDVIGILPQYSGFISFTRTNRAFETHPYPQRTTESIINAIASETAKITVDIMSGSFGFSRKFAKKVVKEAKRKDFGIYAEFLHLALKHHYLIEHIEADGLEWETPDQFQDEIGRLSYSSWLKHFQSLSEWEKRVQLLEHSAEVLIQK